MRQLHLAVVKSKNERCDLFPALSPNSNFLSTEHHTTCTGAVRHGYLTLDVRRETYLQECSHRFICTANLQLEEVRTFPVAAFSGALSYKEKKEYVSPVYSTDMSLLREDSRDNLLPTLSALANSSLPPNTSSTSFCFMSFFSK